MYLSSNLRLNMRGLAIIVILFSTWILSKLVHVYIYITCDSRVDPSTPVYLSCRIEQCVDMFRGKYQASWSGARPVNYNRHPYIGGRII